MTMQLVHDLKDLGALTGGGTCLAIGVFDGVHRGHQVLIERIGAEAARRGVRSLVLTFTQHPLTLLAPPYAPPALTDAAEKARLIAHYGAELCAMIDFTPEFAAIPARVFLEQIVAHTCHARLIVCGEDFRFGTRGEGDTRLLREEGARLGYDVEVQPPLRDGDHPVKSSRIRLCLLGGDLAEANRLLGRPYALTGRVVEGDRRGRTIGFPTANLEPPAGRLVPASGVYAVRARVDNSLRGGMMNIGTRPTFAGQGLTIEVHLFDFAGDLYGRELEVMMIARVREERRFESAEALTVQLRADEEACRAMLGE
jgi:riboflavin kinase / FMN adenylyltransferase